VIVANKQLGHFSHAKELAGLGIPKLCGQAAQDCNMALCLYTIEVVVLYGGVSANWKN